MIKNIWIGPGFQQDSVVINDGRNDYEVTLFDGDVKIAQESSQNQ